MKKILLFLFITAYSFGQIPFDFKSAYLFTNGSLANSSNNNVHTLTLSGGNNHSFDSGIGLENNSALDPNNTLWYFTDLGEETPNYAISFWVKNPKGQLLTQSNFTLQLTASNTIQLQGYIRIGAINLQYFTQAGSTPLNDGQWHHILCTSIHTSNGLENKVYIDGVSEINYVYGGAGQGTEYFFNGQETTTLHSYGDSYSDVKYDSYRFYNRALTSNEINALANEGASTPLRLFVDVNATGNNDGSSWQDAFTSLTNVLNTNLNNLEIWLKDGTYIPTTINTDPRKATFNLPNGVKIYGGFNGTETDKSQRNPSANPTILSGDLNGNDNSNITNTETTRQDNAYHVVSIRGNASNIIVDGITISGGNANGGQLTTGAGSSQYYDIRGGAIYVNPFNANDVIMATFNNCILEKNTGTNVGVYSYYNPTGVVDMYTDVDFKNCIIRDNFSAGLANFIFFGSNGYQIENNGSIENCLFYNNASAQSSAIYLGTSTSAGGNTNSLELNIINSTFAKNSGNNGNVITFANVSPSLVNIKNTIIYDNGSSTPFNLSSGSYPTFYNSIGVPATQGGTNGNLNTDPLFTDANNFDFTLQSGSSAIDSGNNSYITVSEDLLGNARIFNGTVDRGAYEYGSTLSNDSFTNENDYKVFPNPVQNELNIQSDSEIEKIEIYSLEGKLMLQSNAKIINVHSLENGIYILKITDFNGHKKIKKIIKK